MRIHIIQPAIPSYRSKFFQKLQNVLSTQNISICVYASKLDHLGVSSIQSSGFDYKIDSDIKTFFGSRALWQTKLNIPLAKDDILVIDGNPRWLNNYSLLLRAKLNRIPIIWWGQGWSVGSHGINAKIRQTIMKFFDAIILYTDWERDKYIEQGFSPKNIFALNNGLDIESINDEIKKWSHDDIDKFKKSHNLININHWCIFIGRVTEKSEIILLINSLSKTKNDIGLIVVGDGPMVKNAQEEALKLGITHKIVWAGAQFNEVDIAPWMLSANVFVYPGAVGLSLIHGFSYGLPAVIYSDGTRHGPEFSAFCHEENGVSFDRGSVRSLTETIEKIIDDEQKRKSMSKNANSLVQTTFNVTDMTNRFIDAINFLTVR